VETKYTQQLKQLVYDYYNRSLSLETYRAQRNKVIDEMDIEFNGAEYKEERHSTIDQNQQ